MSSQPRSKFWRTVVGFAIGVFLGLSSPTSAVILGLLGAFVGLASAVSGSSDESAPGAVRSFLAEALLAGDLDEPTHRRLLERLTESGAARRDEVLPAAAASRSIMTPPAPQLGSTSAPVRPPAAPSIPEPRPAATPAPTPAPTLPSPTLPSQIAARPRRRLIDLGPVGRALTGFWESLRADFGVQGLGSLGVLLVFTATLGFVVFAFSEVGAAFRPVAELMVPVVLFGMSMFLRHRSAPFMAAALEGLAGAVTPIMAFAAFTDGAGFPPDLERAALVGALASSSLMLAGAYAWVTRRRASTPLRFLVAPLVWIAVGVIGMAIHEEASAALFALVLGAIAVTPWLLARPTDAPLANAARVVVAPGLTAAYTLLVLFAYAEAWPLWPMVFGGLASLVALEGVRRSIQRVWIAQAAVVAVTGVAASVTLGAGWAGAAVLIVALVLLERWLTASPSRVTAGLFGSLAGMGAIAAAVAPGPLFTIGLVLLVWGHTRRIVTHPTLAMVPAFVGAIAPAVAAVGLGWLNDSGIGLMATSAVVLAAAGLVRFVRPRDTYLGVGVLGYGGATGVAAAVTEVVPTDLWVASALAVVGFAVATVPGRSDIRIWLSGVLSVGAWFAFTGTVDLGVTVVASGLAGAGVALVVAGLATPGRAGGHLAALGHMVGGGAIVLVPAEPARIAVLALFIAGWVLEVATDRIGSPLQRLVGDRDTLDMSWVSPVPVLSGLPLLAMAIVAEVRPSAGTAGVALVLAGAAVIYGLVAGLPAWSNPLSLEAAVGGIVASAAGIAVAADFDPLLAADRTLQATVLGAGIVGVVASRRRIQPWMQWYAWALSFPLVFLGGLAAQVPTDALFWSAIGWGAVVSIGALIADNVIAGRRAPWTLTTPWLGAPAVLGSVGVGGGVVVGLAVPVAEMWPVALAAAGWTAAIAYLVRSPEITLVSWGAAALAYVSAMYDAGFDPIEDPILLMWPTLVLIGAAVVIPRTGHFGRLDVPPLMVGAVIGSIAVAAGFAASATTVTWAPIGGALDRRRCCQAGVDGGYTDRIGARRRRRRIRGAVVAGGCARRQCAGRGDCRPASG